MGNRIAWTFLALLVAGAGLGLFWVQNSSRTTQLSIDVGVAAWQLREPVPVPALIVACVGIGVLGAAIPLSLRSWRLSGKIGELERRLAVADLERPQTASGGTRTSSTATPEEPGTW